MPKTAAARVSAEPSCPICGVERRQWIDLSGRPRVQCPGCGAAERHRALAHAWIDGLGALMPLQGKRALVMRPDRADSTFFKLYGARPLTFDVMPRGGPDMVGDVANLRLPNDRFDFVFSHLMLATAPDPEAAVRELARVVRPDGVALFYESVEPGRTREIVDPEEQMAWYGREAFERYGVGLRRAWGFTDLEALLASAFHVRLAETVDPITGRRYVWFWCTRRPAPAGPFLSDEDRLALLAAFSAPELKGEPPFGCACCGEAFDAPGEGGACPRCGGGPRARGLAQLAGGYLDQVVDAEVARAKPLLTFGAVEGEVALLRSLFPTIGTALPHADPRDLSDLPDASLGGLVALDVFDTFAELPGALTEILRVVAPGGLLAFNVRSERLRAGLLAPTPDPDGQPATVALGREWLLDAMTWAGWAAGAVQTHDPASGDIETWFLGRRPG